MNTKDRYRYLIFTHLRLEEATKNTSDLGFGRNRSSTTVILKLMTWENQQFEQLDLLCAQHFRFERSLHLFIVGSLVQPVSGILVVEYGDSVLVHVVVSMKPYLSIDRAVKQRGQL